jgi:hypothetical protein
MTDGALAAAEGQPCSAIEVFTLTPHGAGGTTDEGTTDEGTDGGTTDEGTDGGTTDEGTDGGTTDEGTNDG